MRLIDARIPRRWIWDAHNLSGNWEVDCNAFDEKLPCAKSGISHAYTCLEGADGRDSVDQSIFGISRRLREPLHDEVLVSRLNVTGAQIDDQCLPVAAIAEPCHTVIQLSRGRFHHDLRDTACVSACFPVGLRQASVEVAPYAHASF